MENKFSTKKTTRENETKSESKSIEPIGSSNCNQHKHKSSTPNRSTPPIPSNPDNKQFDLSVFKEENDSKCNKSNHENCISIKRLLAALKYYDALNIINNPNHGEIFNEFINEIYHHQLLDDYAHLIDEHGQKLQEIHETIINDKQFRKCNIKTCDFTARHHRSDNHQNNENALDTKFNFYTQTMDSLHFYLVHCFDAGVRTIKHDDDETKGGDDDNENNSEYFDAAFNRINKMISERKHITDSFNRFKTKNTKFTIVTADDKHQSGLYVYFFFVYKMYGDINTLQNQMD